MQLHFDGRAYAYKYTRNSQELDGIITYDTQTSKWQVVRRCSADESNVQDRLAEKHFIQVINEGFPSQKIVCEK